MFTAIFYFFSIILVFLDWKYYRVPNKIIWAFTSLLILFGLFENQLAWSNFLISFAMLVFLFVLLLSNPKMVLGGGDIKYIMVVGLYLDPLVFPVFLIITGILQTFCLIFFKMVKKHRKAAMLPAMFLSVIVAEHTVEFFYSLKIG